MGTIPHNDHDGDDANTRLLTSDASGLPITSTYDAASRFVTGTNGTDMTSDNYDANGSLIPVQEPSAVRT